MPFPDVAMPYQYAQPPPQMQDPYQDPYAQQQQQAMPDPAMQGMPMPPPGMQPQGMPNPAPAGNERIEEIAESVVQEKWREAKKELNKIEEWKEDVTDKITHLTQKVDDIKSQFDSLHKGIIGKISEYDDNLTNVGTEIKAMEKVFSKVLPALTDSVNKLQRYSGTVEQSAVNKKPRPF
ncbi:MAG: hypothetical protein O2779_05040 [Nanoarchaeota archaeon]|nr:hypothetical protein [Nanoarchaeota archaeon]